MADNDRNDGELDAETRRGLRILADSTKAKGSEGAARRLYKAADTGSAADYQQAEALFDSLPPEQRSSIQSTAETKATTVRETRIRRKKTATSQPTPAPAEFIEWELPDPESTEGIFQMRPPPEPEPPKQEPPRQAPPAARAKAPAPARPAAPKKNSSQDWELNRIPTSRHGKAAPKDDDDDGQNWDWQKLPDDAVTRSSRRKNSAPKSELDALREEMLRTLKD